MQYQFAQLNENERKKNWSAMPKLVEKFFFVDRKRSAHMYRLINTLHSLLLTREKKSDFFFEKLSKSLKFFSKMKKMKKFDISKTRKARGVKLSG